MFALLRLGRLHRAAPVLEKSAGTVGLCFQGQPPAIVAQAGLLLNEGCFAQAFAARELCNLRVLQTHFPGPATAGRATLTFKKNRNVERVIQPARCAKPTCSRSRFRSGTPGRDLAMNIFWPRRRNAVICRP